MLKAWLAERLLLVVGLAAHVTLTACADPTRGPDDAIGSAVRKTLYDHEAANLLRVEVSAGRGVVYLSGEVDEYNHKQKAEGLSRKVDGVLDVVNKVQVEQ